jgi:hypothetical protein
VWRAGSLVAASLIWAGAGAVCAQTSGHDHKLDHNHAKPAARTSAAVTDPRNDDSMLQHRAALLQSAEAALSQGDSTAAIDLFDRAAMLLHAPDTEMGLVRAYMQAGDYRRALAFCAHTAGAHREAAAPAALYAWLLQAGGQNEVAQRTSAEALTRHPVDAVLLQTKQALAMDQPVADAVLRAIPHRLAPYAVMQAGQVEPPASAAVVASGVLLASGQRALVPWASLPFAVQQNQAALWLRNGLGQTTQAVLAQRLDASGLAVMSLSAALSVEPMHALIAGSQDPFAGSPGYVVAYTPTPIQAAAWPWLHTGFHGPAKQAGERTLGIAAPANSQGGLVLDAAGRWVGLVSTDAQGRALLMPVSALRAALPASDFSEAPAPMAGTAPTRMSADTAYERALRFSLQVIAQPH